METAFRANSVTCLVSLRLGTESPVVIRKGYRYWKAGVMLNDLVDARSAPVQMFPTRDPQKSARLMSAMDSLNGRFGRASCVLLSPMSSAG